MKCKLTVLITSFVCALAIIINPLTASASEAGGDYTLWDGDLLFYDNLLTIPLYQSFSNLEHTNSDGDTTKEFKVASFVGSASNLLKLTGTTGTFLNGNASTSYTFTVNSPKTGTVSVSLGDNTYEGMQISSLLANVQGNKTVVTIYVNFNNFEITNPVMYFPVTFDIAYSAKYDEIFDVIPDTVTVNASGNDWLDSVRMFQSIEDLPGSKGFLARAFDRVLGEQGLIRNAIGIVNDNITDWFSRVENKLSTININLINSFTSLTNKLTSNHSEQIANDDANSKAEIDQSKENTNNLMNGYDDQKNKNLNNTVKDDIENFNNHEDILAMLSDQNMEEFSFPSELPEDILGGFSLLSTIMQAIFESSLGLGWIASVGFSFIIIRMLFGISKFMG